MMQQSQFLWMKATKKSLQDALENQKHTEQLLHCADRDKVQPRKENLSKRNVYTRKLAGHDSSYNPYKTSSSNFTAGKNLAKICILFAWIRV